MNVIALPRRSAVTVSAPQPRTLFAWVAKAFTIARERQELKHLDAHLLRDIGLSQEDVDREAARPMWDLPAHR